MQSPSLEDRKLFENLFVLEMANNHWGSIERGKKLIQDFGKVVRHNDIKAAIKLQIRDVDFFIHKDYKGNQDIRYIKKTESTRLSKNQFAELVNEIQKVSCIPMATPFDEKSVDLCVEFGFPIIKIASSDVNDWPLLEKIASTRLPVIASSGGANEKQLDDLVAFFEHRNIPLALNHCVSLYPSQDYQLELNQIDYLKSRYPSHVIGFSTHEFNSWEASMYMSYAKGARTWERHIDIDYEGVPVSPYCSLPEQIDEWFKAFHKAKEMCGSASSLRRNLPKEEIDYLDALVRGVYVKKDIPEGLVVTKENFDEHFYMAIPLLKGQLSVKEIITGLKITRAIMSDTPLFINSVDGPYSSDLKLRQRIENRGLDHN